MFPSEPLPSAGAIAGSAALRQPSIRSGSIWPIMCREVTGAGSIAFRIESSGASMRTAASEAKLLGISGPTGQRTP